MDKYCQYFEKELFIFCDNKCGLFKFCGKQECGVNFVIVKNEGWLILSPPPSHQLGRQTIDHTPPMHLSMYLLLSNGGNTSILTARIKFWQHLAVSPMDVICIAIQSAVLTPQPRTYLGMKHWLYSNRLSYIFCSCPSPFFIILLMFGQPRYPRWLRIWRYRLSMKLKPARV